MNEDSFISPALTGDINERLEKRFADEAVRRQSFNEIENIAKILRIGKKFKVPQAELLYQLHTYIAHIQIRPDNHIGFSRNPAFPVHLFSCHCRGHRRVKLEFAVN